TQSALFPTTRCGGALPVHAPRTAASRPPGIALQRLGRLRHRTAGRCYTETMRRAPSGSSRVLRAALATVTLAAAGLSAGALVSRPAIAQEASRRAWLGVALEKTPGGGVVAKHVINNSPAAKAGVVDGDTILVADGVSIDEVSQLIARVALIGPGNPLA